MNGRLIEPGVYREKVATNTKLTASDMTIYKLREMTDEQIARYELKRCIRIRKCFKNDEL